MSSTTILPGAVRRRASRRLVFGAVGTATVLAGGAVAYAAWSVTATGSSQAASAAAVSATVTAASGSPDLYPGASGAVYFTVTNPNNFPVTFSSATFGAVVSSDETACPAANVTATNQTSLSIRVPANTTSGTLSLSAAVTMAATAPDGCQNKTFTLPTTLAGASSA